MLSLKKIYKKILPLRIRNFFSSWIYSISIICAPLKYYFIIKRLQKKKKLNVYLFMLNADGWKLHSVYTALLNNSRFSPLIIVCPIITKGDSFMKAELEKSISFCVKHNYNYYVAYDFNSDNIIDITEELNPQIIFFTNPNLLSGEELYIDNFSHCLTCYFPYSFRIDTMYDYEYNNRTINKVWKCFSETDLHAELAVEYADNKGNNIKIIGFPHLDRFWNAKSTYKIDDSRKCIVWAPHWTIPGAQSTGLDWSCFLDYAESVLELADKYYGQIRFVMKPHPFLFNTLSQDDVWGKEKTNQYLKRWNDKENCDVLLSDYTALFNESDALIHDSGSFMTEYLVQNKPMAYTCNGIDMDKRFNKWGDVVLSAHSLVYDIHGLDQFVNNVISENDDNLECRTHILKEYNLDNSSVGISLVKYLEQEIR